MSSAPELAYKIRKVYDYKHCHPDHPNIIEEKSYWRLDPDLVVWKPCNYSWENGYLEDMYQELMQNPRLDEKTVRKSWMKAFAKAPEIPEHNNTDWLSINEFMINIHTKELVKRRPDHYALYFANIHYDPEADPKAFTDLFVENVHISEMRHHLENLLKKEFSYFHKNRTFYNKDLDSVFRTLRASCDPIPSNALLRAWKQNASIPYTEYQKSAMLNCLLDYEKLNNIL